MIPLRPGLLRLVREAHADGVLIAIAATASKPDVEALLSQDPTLSSMISLIATNEAVEHEKPEPDVYLWALDRLGLEPADCAAIEDSNVGLRAARAANLPTIVTLSDYTGTDDFSGAIAVLSNLGERDELARSLRDVRPTDGLVDLAFLQMIRDSANAKLRARLRRKSIRYLLRDAMNAARFGMYCAQAPASPCGQQTCSGVA